MGLVEFVVSLSPTQILTITSNLHLEMIQNIVTPSLPLNQESFRSVLTLLEIQQVPEIIAEILSLVLLEQCTIRTREVCLRKFLV